MKPMPIRVSAVAALSDNYIWVIDDGDAAVVVDPGEASPVARHLEHAGLRLDAILLTHHHRDHVEGVHELLRLRGAVRAEDAATRVFGPAGSGIAGVTQSVSEGAEITFGAGTLTFSVLAVPGHTLDHLVYVARSSDPAEAAHLFCGDTLFSCGCGRVFEGSHEQMVSSLNRLGRLPAGTRVYPAHEYTLKNIQFALEVEPANASLHRWATEAAHLRRQGLPTLPSTIGKEQEVNPFLRLDTPAVAERAMALFGAKGRSPLDVFAALRAARNAR